MRFCCVCNKVLIVGFKYVNLNIYMIVYGMVFNNIMFLYKMLNNVG